MSLQTAILYFSRHTSAELKYKTFFGSNKQLNKKIADQLYKATLKTIHQTKLPVYHISEEEQQGNSFAEKISNAFAHIFEKGYKEVIAIGSDCPGLNKTLILSAAAKLKEQDVVLGPTPNGGCYLIGIQTGVFKKDNFQNLPWQKNNLLKVFLNDYENTASLPPLQDINHQYDFYRLKFGVFNQTLVKKLLSLLATYLVIFIRVKSVKSYISCNHISFAGRAP